MPSDSTIPNARAFVRSLNVLLKFSRLYGLDHARSAGQFEISWNELQGAARAAINMHAVVRFVRSRQAGFEMVGMGLEDRAKLRRLLVSLDSEAAPVLGRIADA